MIPVSASDFLKMTLFLARESSMAAGPMPCRIFHLGLPAGFFCSLK